MKVTNNKIGPMTGKLDTVKTGKAESGKNSAASEKLSGTEAGRAAKANVHLSERAQLMQKAKEIASQPMEVDEAKVARLQKLIDEGKYKVDAEAIADRLVDEHLSLPD